MNLDPYSIMNYHFPYRGPFSETTRRKFDVLNLSPGRYFYTTMVDVDDEWRAKYVSLIHARRHIFRGTADGLYDQYQLPKKARNSRSRNSSSESSNSKTSNSSNMIVSNTNRSRSPNTNSKSGANSGITIKFDDPSLSPKVGFKDVEDRTTRKERLVHWELVHRSATREGVKGRQFHVLKHLNRAVGVLGGGSDILTNLFQKAPPSEAELKMAEAGEEEEFLKSPLGTSHNYTPLKSIKDKGKDKGKDIILDSDSKGTTRVKDYKYKSLSSNKKNDTKNSKKPNQVEFDFASRGGSSSESVSSISPVISSVI